MGMMLCLEVAAADREVVLVTASTSPLHNLDSLELRKIYLGFTVKRDGKIIKGLRNTEDENLNSIFLQTVVAMSEKSYKNRLLFLTLRQGIPRPTEYGKIEDLLSALSTKPYSVSYMWKKDAVRSSQVKILRVLWQQN
ncbi:MAG: hypothetical protein GQ550_01790 [Gammaproteobacteria bacterium]|nr:hypothetical protein [Gammaproteobacteria bacterium]